MKIPKSTLLLSAEPSSTDSSWAWLVVKVGGGEFCLVVDSMMMIDDAFDCISVSQYLIRR